MEKKENITKDWEWEFDKIINILHTCVAETQLSSTS